MLTAKVKSVLSGDTVVLVPVNPKPGMPEVERTLSLAFVVSPRLSSNESHGFESREYLRKLTVGKPVQFKVLYIVNNREYGDVRSPAFDSLIERELAEGIVKLRNDASAKESYETYRGKLDQAQSKAQAGKNGVWADSISPVKIESVLPAELIGSSRQVPSIVERVISGDRLQVRVLLDNQVHYVGQILIAGVKAPRSASQDTPGEPFGDASRQFVTSRLLQRSIKLQFLDFSSMGVPIAKVVHPAGDISDAILSAGLGTVSDWQSHYLGAEAMGKLRAAEKSAKDAKLNIWKNTQAKVVSSSKSYEAIVAKVVSPDTYVLRLPSNEERTVQLASVRAPRKNEPTQEPFAAAAKEFARSKFIGKKVNVELVAIRPKSDQFEERHLVTMSLNGTNIATTIIENGWATVIRHRKDDDDRSSIWDELLEKETAAIEAKKGIHSKKPPASERLVDASESTVRAKGFLPSLERQTKLPAVVDYISSGGRFRLLVPRENCILTLVLSGIRVPRPQEEYGNMALDFATKRLWQRDVRITVLNVDKTGAFIGHLFLPGSNIPLSLGLVKEGLATVHEYSARQSGFGTQLMEAEQAAQKEKKGIWSNYEPEPEVERTTISSSTDSSDVLKPSRNYVDVIISGVTSEGQVAFRRKSRDDAYTQLVKDLTSFNNTSANSASFSFKAGIRKGELVTVVQSGQYQRGKLLYFEGLNYTVHLLDTGVDIVTSTSKLRPLPLQFSPATTPAFAETAELTFVQVPPSGYLEDYIAFLKDFVGQTLAANIDATSPSTFITLYTADSKGPHDSLNSILINEGYAYAENNIPFSIKSDSWKAVFDALKEIEDGARIDRVGVWEYGDARHLD